MRATQISLRDLILLIAICALSTGLIVQRTQLVDRDKQIESLQQELDGARPIPFSIVARQFKEALRPYLKVEVSSVWYDATKDTYTVEFGWPDKSGTVTGYSVPLKKDELGRYSGVIFEPEFHFKSESTATSTPGIKISVFGKAPSFRKSNN